MIRCQEDMHGELSSGHKIARDAGAQEERSRIRIEVVLAIGIVGADNAAIKDALISLLDRIDNPRPEDELHEALLASIKGVAIK
jgi:hypothetical protein